MSRTVSRRVFLLVLFLLAACSGDNTTNPPPPPPQDPGLNLTDPGVTLFQRPITCPGGADCLGFVQVLWSGERRVNPLGDPSVITSIDTLDAATVAQVQTLALDPAMVEIFKRGNAGCAGSQEPVEELGLRQGGDEFIAKITGCTTGPAAQLRDLLLSLAAP